MDTLNEKGQLTFDYDGQEVVLTKDDLLIDVSQKDGYVTEEDNYVTVVLDTNLTPELIVGRLCERTHKQDSDHAQGGRI
mgnify:CR=1 FL=1